MALVSLTEAGLRDAAMETWAGGNCLRCGEWMPAAAVHCRYCQAALVEVPGNAVKPMPEVSKSNSDSDLKTAVTPVKYELGDSHSGGGRESISESIQGSRRQITAVASKERRVENQASSGGTDPPKVVEQTPSDQAKRSPMIDKSQSWIAKRGVWLAAILLLAPLCVSGPVPGDRKPLSFTLPMVHSGDEPHNLVLINSVIGDGDLDVKNNYADVHMGGYQAGRKFAGWALDHHVNWYWRSHLISWWRAYEMDRGKWDKDSENHPVPTLRKDSIHRPVNSHEYSSHSPGIALLTAPFLVAFRGTRLVEPMALLLSSLATVGGLFAFCRLIRPYVGHGWFVVAVAAVAFLGSPLWHYGRTLYAEPFMALCGVAAYTAVLRENRYLVAGLFLGAGVLLGVPFVVLAMPIILEVVFRKKWVEAIRCAAPILIAFGIVLFWNYRMHGEWLKFPQKWGWGFPLEGVVGFLLSWKNGLILFSPAVLVSMLGVPEWFRRQRRDAILMGSATVLYLLLMASSSQWWGGAGFSARLLVPIMPFLFAPIAFLVESNVWKKDRRIRWGSGCLIMFSIVFGVIGAFGCEHVWNKHPIQLMF